MELYDADLLIRDCILHILGRKAGEGKYPYAEKKYVSMNFLGGYNVGIKNIKEIPEEEIPAYYCDRRLKDRFRKDYNYIRAKYIYDRVMDENPASRNQAILNFIWTRKSGKGIKKEDGNDTYIVFSNRLKDCVSKKVHVSGIDKYIIIIEPDRKYG